MQGHADVRTGSSTDQPESWLSGLTLVESAVVPLYHQLKEQLRPIAEGLDAGVLMPSETEIVRHFGVSRATARRAISDLVQEGILVVRQGRGTFTAPIRIEASLSRPAGFTETMRRLGRHPSTELLSVEEVVASPKVQSRLRLRTNTSIVVVERLRLLDGEPCMVERTHLPAQLVLGLPAKDLTQSIYELLASDYGLRPIQGTESIIAVNADRRMAKLLHVPIAAALLATARLTYARPDLPIEYTLRHARGDLCSFVVALSEASTLVDHAAADPLLQVAG